jgi:hypothetical protein
LTLDLSSCPHTHSVRTGWDPELEHVKYQPRSVRYEYLIERGYGNYLGLSQLQCYVAEQVGLSVGQLTVVAVRAQVDDGRRRL